MCCQVVQRLDQISAIREPDLRKCFQDIASSGRLYALKTLGFYSLLSWKKSETDDKNTSLTPGTPKVLF